MNTIKPLFWSADYEDNQPSFRMSDSGSYVDLSLSGCGFDASIYLGDSSLRRLRGWIDEVLAEHEATFKEAQRRRTEGTFKRVIGEAAK